MGFYDEMADVATELLGEFQQGVARLARVTVTPETGRPWDVTNSAPTYTDLLAVAIPVERKYVDGTRIVGGEDQVTFAVPNLSPEPNIKDKIEMDGRLRTTVAVRRIPALGTPVAYIFFVKD